MLAHTYVQIRYSLLVFLSAFGFCPVIVFICSFSGATAVGGD